MHGSGDVSMPPFYALRYDGSAFPLTNGLTPGDKLIHHLEDQIEGLIASYMYDPDIAPMAPDSISDKDPLRGASTIVPYVTKLTTLPLFDPSPSILETGYDEGLIEIENQLPDEAIADGDIDDPDFQTKIRRRLNPAQYAEMHSILKAHGIVEFFEFGVTGATNVPKSASICQRIWRSWVESVDVPTGTWFNEPATEPDQARMLNFALGTFDGLDHAVQIDSEFLNDLPMFEPNDPDDVCYDVTLMDTTFVVDPVIFSPVSSPKLEIHLRTSATDLASGTVPTCSVYMYDYWTSSWDWVASTRDANGNPDQGIASPDGIRLTVEVDNAVVNQYVDLSGTYGEARIRVVHWLSMGSMPCEDGAFTTVTDMLHLYASDGCSDVCPADVNGDGLVDSIDIEDIAEAMGCDVTKIVPTGPGGTMTAEDVCGACAELTTDVAAGDLNCLDVDGNGVIECLDAEYVQAVIDGAEVGWACDSG